MDVKTLVYIFIYSFIVLLNLFPLAPNNFWFYSVRGKPVLVLLSHFNGSPREWRGFDLSSHETGTIIKRDRPWQGIIFPRFAKGLGHH